MKSLCLKWDAMLALCAKDTTFELTSSFIANEASGASKAEAMLASANELHLAAHEYIRVSEEDVSRIDAFIRDEVVPFVESSEMARDAERAAGWYADK